MAMPKLLKVEPREGYRVYVKYDDGACGEVDLSHNAGKGVFKVWDEPGVFEQVHVTEYNAVGWGDGLDICPDSVYFRLTGKKPEEMMSGLRKPWMSELCRFRGAVMCVYHDEHNPPHFHVRYSGLDVQVGIEPVRLLEGSLPANIRRLVFEWAQVRQAELAEAWERAQRHQDPGKIAPLD